MKKFRKLLLIIVGLLIFPNIVNASSGSISISAPSTGVVGNNMKVTVTVSSGTAMGAWEYALSYDRTYLELSSSPDGANGNKVVGYATNSSTKSKSYTFSFKVKKSGSTTLRITDSDGYGMNGEADQMKFSNGSKTVTLKTQEEIEASYSKDAYLKSLGVEGYSVTPEFDKEKYEYELEVENEVEKIEINARVNDANASVAGIGEKELIEGPNKFEIVVTAQKGNSLTYTLTVTRKELDPIKVTIDNKELTIVRRKDTLPTELTGMVEKTVQYEGEEIPALYSDITDITVVGVKNEEGNIFTYVFENGSITNPYIELSSNIKGIVPLNVEESKDFKEYKIKEIEIEGLKIKAYVLKDDSKFAVIYALDATNNEKKYYTYDMESKTIMLYNNEIKDFYTNQINMYRYVVLGAIGVVIILLLILLFRKPKKVVSKKDLEKIDEEDTIIEVKEGDYEQEETPKKEKKKKNKLKDLLYEPEEDEVEEVQEIKIDEHSGNTEQINNLLEKIENDKNDKPRREVKKSIEDDLDDDTFVKTKKINLDEIAETKTSEVEEPELSKRELKRLEKEEKRRAKKEAKEQKKLLDRDEF
jgi:hypothetical protein